MNKKYLNAVLLGTLLVTSIGTFTSCKDYDDDIKGLQEQIDKNGSTVSDLQNQLTTLKVAAEAAKTAADAAKAAATAAQTAANAAKASGDQAKIDAANALAAAEAAKAAAAAAKVDAINEVTKQVTALKTLMEQALTLKVDQSVFNGAILAVNAQIKAIDENLSNLSGVVAGIDAKVATNTADITNAKKAIETLIAADANLQTQLNQLKSYAENTESLAQDNKAEIEAAKKAIQDAQAEIQKLWDDLAGANSQIATLFDRTAEHTNLIAALTTRVGASEAEQAQHAKRITALESGLGLAQADIVALTNELQATKDEMSTMEERIDGELSDIKSEISGIQTKIGTIDSQIRGINTDLSGLHVLIISRLSSITFAPDLIVDGIEAIRFNSLKYDGMSTNENASVPETYRYSTAAPATASYHFNPATFNLENAVYGYIDRSIEVISTASRAAMTSKWVQIIGNPKNNAAQGTVEFKLLRLNAHSTQPADEKINSVALQATLTGKAVDQGEQNVVITSPYTAIYDNIITPNEIFIGDNLTLLVQTNNAHYATTFAACKDEAPRYKMAYDGEFNLKSLVATCLVENESHAKFPVEEYGLSYKFSVATSVYDIPSGSTTTNQQKDLKCTNADNGTFKATDAQGRYNQEFVGRTPIFKVELVDANGKIVRRGFVKVEIVAKKNVDMNVTLNGKEIYGCKNTASKEYKFDENYLRENIYRLMSKNDNSEVGMSHQEFWAIYELAGTEVTKNGIILPNASIEQPKLINGTSSDGTATKVVTWRFSHEQVGYVGLNGASLYATLTVKNKIASSKYPEFVKFHFSIMVETPEITLDEKATVVNDILWEKSTDGKYIAFKVNAARPETTFSPASECQISQDITKAYSSYKVSVPNGVCSTNWYEIEATYSNGQKTLSKLSGVRLNGTTISLNKNDENVKEALNSEGGLQATIIHKYKIESGREYIVNSFLVTFIRPVTFTMPDGISVTDAKTGGDIVSFQHNGLLTDWRGESILKSTWSHVSLTTGRWVAICTEQYTYVDGHYKELTPAYFSIEQGEITFTNGNESTTMYTGQATYKFYSYENQDHGNDKHKWVEKETKTFILQDNKPSQDAVQSYLEAEALKYSVYKGYGKMELLGEISYNEVVISPSEEIKYTYIKNIVYKPATYEWIPGTRVLLPHTHSPKPTYRGTVNGQTSGCWEWRQWEYTGHQLTPGQFWMYYGEIKDIKLDLNINSIKTSLSYNGNKLPTGAVLTQMANNAVKYENDRSPITYPYTITIPASVEYGWGILNTKLVITANPVNSSR